MTDHDSHNSLGPPTPASPRRGSIQTNISTGTGISGSSSMPTAGSLVTNLTSIGSNHSLTRSALESISAESLAIHHGKIISAVDTANYTFHKKSASLENSHRKVDV
jgi:hypothetical protein